MLKEYRACAWSGVGKAPSGADVVSQLSGGVTWFDGHTNEAERLSWPFKDLAFTLFRTGFKIATHEHLKDGAEEVPYENLRKLVLQARLGFDRADAKVLVDAVQSAASVLRQSGLTTSATTDLLKSMNETENIFYAAKGCGAMGADIVLGLHEPKSSGAVQAWAQAHNLEICGSLATLSSGLGKIQDSRSSR